MTELRRIESREEAEALSAAYYEALAAPIDGFWQYVVVAGAQFHEILVDGEPAGHAAVANEGKLVQFSLRGSFRAHSGQVFAELLAGGLADRAGVSTKEPEFLSLCLDGHRGLSIDCFLFEWTGAAEDGASVAPARLRPAGLEDIPAIREACEPAFDGYYEELVAKGGLFVAGEGRSIPGIGELRVLPSHGKAFADLGVHVAEARRGKGLGASILRGLGELCAGRGLEPLASCNSANAASRRALEKAGFRAAQRLLEIRLA